MHSGKQVVSVFPVSETGSMVHCAHVAMTCVSSALGGGGCFTEAKTAESVNKLDLY